LHKFGVRPLPKKKMILKLKEIYDYTHQGKPEQYARFRFKALLLYAFSLIVH